MGIREAIGKGFGIAKGSLNLVLVLFIFGAVFNVLNVFVAPPAPPAGAQPPPPSPLMITLGIVFVLLTIFFQAGSMSYVRDAIRGGSANIGNFVAGGSKYYVKLLLLGLLVAVIIGVFVLIAALLAGVLGSAIPVLAVPIAILLGLLGVYFVVMLFLSPYAVVVDEQGVKTSLGTSVRLVKKNLWKLLGITAWVVVIGLIVGVLLGAVLAGVSVAIKNQQAVQLVFALASSLVNAFLGVFVTAAFMNLYLSLPDRNNV